MTAIIDYGIGNLFSVKNALDYIGEESVITKDKEIIKNADRIILPGVGAFPQAIYNLIQMDFIDFLREQAVKKPFLGICLGMQILLEIGFELGETTGLSLITGCVREIKAPIIPHMGWNKLESYCNCPLMDGADGEYVYFVHSYKVVCAADNVGAYCEYFENIPAVIFNGKTIFGVQFHPEKSGETGLKILRNFVNLEVQ